MAKVVAIANQKGGVGKTTTTINLGASLAILERRVLIIDADPQANATSGVGIPPEELEGSIYNVLINGLDVNEVVYETETPNLHIVPSSIQLVGAEVELINRFRREDVLKNSVVEPLRDQYDYILIDCLPSLGLLTINALTAADSVLVPVQCEYFALEGLSKLQDTIKLVQQQLNPQLKLEGILLSMFDQRLRLANLVVEQVRSTYGTQAFETIIHRNARISEAPNMHMPVVMINAGSRGAKNFLNLAEEFLLKNGETVTRS
ncbi:ParA family protein [Neolewinella maritima]|nr:AAA family ATPase [Neolewinella maritima]